jgi:hypothetical protein
MQPQKRNQHQALVWDALTYVIIANGGGNGRNEFDS